MDQNRKSLSPAEDFSRRNNKLFINVANMLENFKFPVLEVKRQQTLYGEKVQVELYDNILFLPKSFNNKITDDEIKEFNTGHYYLIKQMKMHEPCDIKFKKAKFVKGFKKILQIRDILDHISYPIYAMQRKHTIYGERIQVDILDEIIFLPKRFNGLTDQTINEINHGNYCLKKIPGNSKILDRLEIQTAPIDFQQKDESSSKIQAKEVLNTEDYIMECKVEQELLLTQKCPTQNLENTSNEGNELSEETKKRTECQQIIEEDSTAWTRVTNKQLNYDFNIEMEQNANDSNNGTIETAVLNRNESDIDHSINEERVDLNRVLKEETKIKAPADNSPIKNVLLCFNNYKEIEKQLCYYDNDTILLSDDDEEDEVNDDCDVPTNTNENGAMLSPQISAKRKNKEVHCYKCLLCARKNVTRSAKSMLKHMKKFHDRDDINASEKINDQKVLCGHCNNSYSSGYISQHVKRIHNTSIRAKAASKVQNSTPSRTIPELPEFLEKEIGGPVTRAEHEAVLYLIYQQQRNAAQGETSVWSARESNFYEDDRRTEPEVTTYGSLSPRESGMEM